MTTVETRTAETQPGGPSAGRRWRLTGWYPGLPWWGKLLTMVGVLALAAVLPYIENVPLIGPQIITEGTDWSTTLFKMAYFVLLALGLNVVVGYAGMLDLGYVGFFAIGAYTVSLLTSPDSTFGTKWPWLAALPFGLAVTMIFGVILGWPTLRLRGDYLAIVTLGFAEIIRLFADNTPDFLRGDRGFSTIPHPPGTWPDGTAVFGVTDATPYYWLGLFVIVLVVLAVRNLDRSRVGRSWLAIREDEEAAEVMGVRTVKYKLWAFAIGALIGGLGGVLYAPFQGFINSRTFVVQFSVLVLSAVVLGGSGNIPGAILGGAVVAYIPERLRGVKDPLTHTDLFDWRFVMFGVAILLIMIFRPQGLVPSRRRAMELKDRAKEVAP